VLGYVDSLLVCARALSLSLSLSLSLCACVHAAPPFTYTYTLRVLFYLSLVLLRFLRRATLADERTTRHGTQRACSCGVITGVRRDTWRIAARRRSCTVRLNHYLDTTVHSHWYVSANLHGRLQLQPTSAKE